VQWRPEKDRAVSRFFAMSIATLILQARSAAVRLSQRGHRNIWAKGEVKAQRLARLICGKAAMTLAICVNMLKI